MIRALPNGRYISFLDVDDTLLVRRGLNILASDYVVPRGCEAMVELLRKTFNPIRAMVSEFMIGYEAGDDGDYYNPQAPIFFIPARLDDGMTGEPPWDELGWRELTSEEGQGLAVGSELEGTLQESLSLLREIQSGSCRASRSYFTPLLIAGIIGVGGLALALGGRR